MMKEEALEAAVGILPVEPQLIVQPLRCLRKVTAEEIMKLCRFCMSQHNVCSIFQLQHCGEEFSSVIKYALNIKVKMNDKLPNIICTNCMQKILAISEFRKMFTTSEKIIRNALGAEKQARSKKRKCPTKKKTKSKKQLLNGERQLSNVKKKPDVVFSKVKEELPECEEIVIKSEPEDEEDSERPQENKAEYPPQPIEKINGALYPLVTVSMEEEFMCKLRDMNRGVDHPKTNSPTLEGGYTCNTCQRTFRTPMLLEVHESSHTVGKDYVCKYCTRRFKQKLDLNYHVLHDHEKDMPYYCDVCEKGFQFQELLSDHKEYFAVRKKSCKQSKKCDVCDEVLPSSESLAFHMAQHRNNTFADTEETIVLD